MHMNLRPFFARVKWLAVFTLAAGSIVWIGCQSTDKRKVATSQTLGTAEGGPKACEDSLLKIAAFDPAELTGVDLAQDAFQQCLAGLIRIDTTNPPGNEAAAVEYLQHVFSTLGIDHRVVNVGDPARANIIAGWPRLIGEGGAPALPGVVLLSHLDVVHAHGDQWKTLPGIFNAPFSGSIVNYEGEQVMMGRGAIDMKNITVMQLITMAMLKQKNITPNSPVYFVATADEEDSSIGIRGLLAEAKSGGRVPELANPRVVLTEGGFGVRGAVGTGSALHTIGVEERGGAWLRVSDSSPVNQFKALGSIGLLPVDAGIVAMRNKLGQPSCQIVSVDTPQSKANVVPSKLGARLSCEGNVTADMIQQAFDVREWAKRLANPGSGADGVQPALVEAQIDGSNVSIAIKTATSGHGSSFAGISVLDIFGWGVQILGAIPVAKKPPMLNLFRYQVSPATKVLLNTVAKNHDLLNGSIPSVQNIDRYLGALNTMLGQKVFDALASRVGIDKLFRTNCTWTGYRFAPDVAGGPLSEVVLDCRIIDLVAPASGESHPDRFVKALKTHWDSNAIVAGKVEITNGWNFSASSFSNREYKAIAAILESSFPGTIASPLMIPGGTDATYLRDPSSIGLSHFSGVPAYGFTPALVTADIVKTFHGSNERFPVSQFAPSAGTYFKIVQELAK